MFDPAIVEVGVAEADTPKSADAPTDVVSVAELLDCTGSASLMDIDTVDVAVTYPTAAGLTTRVTVAPLPAGMFPNCACVPPCCSTPCDVDPEMKFTFGISVVKRTFCAVNGPLFVTTIL